MKLKLLLPALSLLAAMCADARMPEKGYRGFVENSIDFRKEPGFFKDINALYSGFEEIAVELGLSVKTVKNQLTKALSRLRESLGKGRKPFFLPFL
ncbi:MAG: hypothetical protein K2I69_06570 [Muribaculaceae bacterium]|nr:hypothetical protein [Muribaculaceae bacterium]